MEGKVNVEKIGIYVSIAVAMSSFIFYIADMKERIAKLEVKIEHVEKHIDQMANKGE